MGWTVTIKNSARKGIDKLPEKVRRVLALLMIEIETADPSAATGPITASSAPAATIVI